MQVILNSALLKCFLHFLFLKNVVEWGLVFTATVLLSDKPWYLNIPREVEGVNTYIGIQNMIEALENDRRKGIPQGGVLILFGFSLDRNVNATKYYAHLAKAVDINMFCVGVGPTDKKQRYCVGSKLRFKRGFL